MGDQEGALHRAGVGEVLGACVWGACNACHLQVDMEFSFMYKAAAWVIKQALLPLVRP